MLCSQYDSAFLDRSTFIAQATAKASNTGDAIHAGGKRYGQAHANVSNPGDVSHTLTYTKQINEFCNAPLEACVTAFAQHALAIVVPDAIIYSAVFCACETGVQPEMALEVFHAMQVQGVVPDILTYSTLIGA